jgi:hypothetical protein
MKRMLDGDFGTGVQKAMRMKKRNSFTEEERLTRGILSLT